MNESGVYNESDLAPFHRRLADLRQIIQADVDGGKHPLAMTKLLERQLSECGTEHFPIILNLYAEESVDRHRVELNARLARGTLT